MKTYKYKNISKIAQVILGVGEVQPGEAVEAAFRIENPNFVLVKDLKQETKEETK